MCSLRPSRGRWETRVRGGDWEANVWRSSVLRLEDYRRKMKIRLSAGDRVRQSKCQPMSAAVSCTKLSMLTSQRRRSSYAFSYLRLQKQRRKRKTHGRTDTRTRSRTSGHTTTLPLHAMCLPKREKTGNAFFNCQNSAVESQPHHLGVVRCRRRSIPPPKWPQYPYAEVKRLVLRRVSYTVQSNFCFLKRPSRSSSRL